MAPPLIVQIVVGTAEEISSGQGETAVTMAQVAARLGISITGVRNLVLRRQLTPCAKFDKTHLFVERDVEELRAKRET